MKHTTILLTVFLLISGIAFAEGAKESDSIGPGPGRADSWGNRQWQAPAGEEMTVTGILSLSEYGPVLKADDTEYLLMVPRFIPEGVSVEEGDELTVTGFVHDSFRQPRWGYRVDEAKKLMGVTAVVIDGEEFEITRPRWSGAGFGDCPYYKEGFGYEEGYGGRHMRGPMGHYDGWGRGRSRGMRGGMYGMGPRF